MISMINTGEGIWNPLVFLLSFTLILLLVYIIRSFGNKDYNKNSIQTQPFLSGNPENENSLIRSSNMYWGFFEVLDKIYHRLTKFHTGNINDYTSIFIFVLTLILLIIILF